MTFNKFRQVLKSKYPQSEVYAHGKFGNTEHNKKVALAFEPDGKVYEYYGAYEDILNKCGIKVISKERFVSLELMLITLREMNGEPDFFGGFIDNTEAIKERTEELESIRQNYMIV